MMNLKKMAEIFYILLFFCAFSTIAQTQWDNVFVRTRFQNNLGGEANGCALTCSIDDGEGYLLYSYAIYHPQADVWGWLTVNGQSTCGEQTGNAFGKYFLQKNPNGVPDHKYLLQWTIEGALQPQIFYKWGFHPINDGLQDYQIGFTEQPGSGTVMVNSLPLRIGYNGGAIEFTKGDCDAASSVELYIVGSYLDKDPTSATYGEFHPATYAQFEASHDATHPESRCGGSQTCQSNNDLYVYSNRLENSGYDPGIPNRENHDIVRIYRRPDDPERLAEIHSRPAGALVPYIPSPYYDGWDVILMAHVRTDSIQQNPPLEHHVRFYSGKKEYNEMYSLLNRFYHQGQIGFSSGGMHRFLSIYSSAMQNGINFGLEDWDDGDYNDLMGSIIKNIIPVTPIGTVVTYNTISGKVTGLNGRIINIQVTGANISKISQPVNSDGTFSVSVPGNPPANQNSYPYIVTPVLSGDLVGGQITPNTSAYPEVNGADVVVPDFDYSYTFKGFVHYVQNGNALPVAGATVSITEIPSAQGTTSNYGYFEIPGIHIKDGIYTWVISRSCFTRYSGTFNSAIPNMTPPPTFLTDNLNFTYGPLYPAGIKTCEIITFSAVPCDQVVAFTWDFDDGSPQANGEIVTHTYTATGVKNVTLTLTKNDNSTVVVNKSITVVQGIMPLPHAGWTLTQGSYGSSPDKISDPCPDVGIDIKLISNIGFDACGDKIPHFNTEETWTFNGTQVTPVNGEIQVTITDGQDNILTLYVIDEYGHSDTKTVNFSLERCTPNVSADIVVKQIIPGQADINVDGEWILDEQGGKVNLTIQPRITTSCDCMITSIHDFSWTLKRFETGEEFDWNGDIPQPYSTPGYGTYYITFDGIYETADNPREQKHFTASRRIRVGMQIPLVKCPPYGCGSIPNSCSEFIDTISTEEIRQTTTNEATSPWPGLQVVPAKGEGFAGKKGTDGNGNQVAYGFWDAGFLKYVKLGNDFVFLARINNPGSMTAAMQAGVMIRPSSSSFDRMIFIGKQDSKAFIINRTKQRQDVAPMFTGNDYNWFYMQRVKDTITCFSSPNGVSWIRFEIAGNNKFLGWDGPMDVGIAAAGDVVNTTPENIEFENIYLSTTGDLLSKPNTIINSVFAAGNLISNWSFENADDFFVPTGTGITYNTRFESDVNFGAYEGRYYLSITQSDAGSTMQTSQPLPIYYEKNGVVATMVKVSFRVRSLETSDINPKVIFYRNDGSPSDETPLLEITSPTTGWYDYDTTVLLPSRTDYYGFNLQLIDDDLSVANRVDFDNVVVTPVFGSENKNIITTMSYADGMNAKFQTVLPMTDKDIVSALILNKDGTVERTLPYYASTSTKDVKLDPMVDLKTFYSNPNNADWDFSELDTNFGKIGYELSPLNLINAKYGRKSQMDVKLSYSNDGDAVNNILPHNLITATKTAFTTPDKYQIKQEYQNAYGQIIKTENSFLDPNVTSKTLVSTRDPDILNRTWSTTSPMSNDPDPNLKMPPTSYRYSTIDQVMESTDPDAGTKQSLFDRVGNLRFFRDANKANTEQFLVNLFDALGRIRKVYLVSDPSGNLWNTSSPDAAQLYADDSVWPERVSLPVTPVLLLQNYYDEVPIGILPTGLIASMFSNIKGRIVAQCSYDGSDAVANFYSYDERGNIEDIWRSIPGLPLQRNKFVYDLSGKVITKKSSGREPKTGNIYLKTEEYAYDDLSRLLTVSDRNSGDNSLKLLASYTYLPDGKVRTKMIGPNLKTKFNYFYDVAERLDSQSVQNNISGTWTPGVYGQRLHYETADDGSGNITSQTYYLAGAVKPYRRFNYTYDNFNRLLNATFGKETSSFPDESSMTDGEFASQHSYDDEGRITAMAAGPLAASFPSQSGEYSYYSNSHRLEKISNTIMTGGKDRSATGNYVYDQNGNVITDKGLKRTIEYDYRNLPVKITEFDDANMNTIKNITAYLYDAAGNRVKKTQVR